MENIIEIEPNSEGKYFITLYGTRYEIVLKKPKSKPTKTEQ